MTSEEAADICKVARSTILRWCSRNNIKRLLAPNGIMSYDITNKDLEIFRARRKAGWEKGRRRKPEGTTVRDKRELKKFWREISIIGLHRLDCQCALTTEDVEVINSYKL